MRPATCFREAQSGMSTLSEVGLLELRGDRCQDALPDLHGPASPKLVHPDPLGVLAVHDREILVGERREHLEQRIQADADTTPG